MTSLLPDTSSYITTTHNLAMSSVNLNAGNQQSYTVDITPPDGYDKLWLTGYRLNRLDISENDSSEFYGQLYMYIVHQMTGESRETVTSTDVFATATNMQISSMTETFEMYPVTSQTMSEDSTGSGFTINPVTKDIAVFQPFQTPIEISFASLTGATQENDWLTLAFGRYSFISSSTFASTGQTWNELEIFWSETDPYPPPPPVTQKGRIYRLSPNWDNPFVGLR